MENTFKKQERLCGRNEIGRLLAKGRHGSVDGLRYCYLSGSGRDCNRILVSVPKKLFRRAVRRNYLKRLIREAYRTQKALLPGTGTDLMFIYATKEILSAAEVRRRVADILQETSRHIGTAEQPSATNADAL